jgi:hypothetical protein
MLNNYNPYQPNYTSCKERRDVEENNYIFSERKTPTFPFFKRLKTRISGAIGTMVSVQRRYRSDVDEECRELY